MAISGTNSLLGIGKNAAGAKGGAPASPTWIEAFAPDFSVMDNAKVRRSHIGGSPFARGAYKVGTGAAFGAQFEATSGILGTVLDASLGSTTTGDWWRITMTATGGTFTISDGTNTTAAIAYNADAETIRTRMTAATPAAICVYADVGVQRTSGIISIGVWKSVKPTLTVAAGSLTGGTATILKQTTRKAHRIGMDSADKWATPYVGVYRRASGAMQELASDAKIAQLGVAVAGGDAVVCSVGGAGLGYSKPSSWPTGAYDANPIMTSKTGADISLLIDGTTYGTSATNNVNVLSANIALANGLSRPDRYKVGSTSGISLEVLTRQVNIEMAIEIEDAALYEQILLNGNAWRETVALGNIRTSFLDEDTISNIAQFCADNVVFNMVAVARPNELVMAKLTATALQLDSGAAEVYWHLFNEVTSY